MIAIKLNWRLCYTRDKYVVLSTRHWLSVCNDRCFLVDKSVGLSLLEPLCASVKLSVVFYRL